MREEAAEGSSRFFSYGLIVMTVTHTLTHVFQRMHLALFPIIKQEFSLSLQDLGLIAAIPFLCQAILAIPTGLLSDRIGSKKLIVASIAIAVAGSIIAGQTMNPIMLTLAVSLVYVNTVVYHPAAYSFTTKLFSPRDRSKALGVHGAGGTFGMAIGPISVGILLGIFALGWRQVYIFWVVPLFLGLLLVLKIRSDPREEIKFENRVEEKGTRTRESFFTVNLTMFLTFVSFRMLAGQMIDTFLTVYLTEQRGMNEVLSSLVYGGVMLTGLAAAPLGGVIASRIGDRKWVLISLSSAYASLGIAVIAPDAIMFIVFYITYGFFNNLSMAANSSIVATLSPSRRRGLGYALYFLPGEIMGILAPIVAALIAVAFGLTSIFFVSLTLFIIGLVILRLGVKI